ncbi:hypothetical protein NDR87_14195 [Nocardia sp. CDC159]|uniref:Uncharacterized protein n=1 Tax=Nocardia pulmonis TaxID=2951408 RepID=A0A9X2E697_9NOCA|nr:MULTISPECIES: hypothetical protein [Nocardia]MCM6774425.1 hypothetical protein [Nocardia pulmonis]MCM6787509.1 hypothetical protein [Nocardia sp. CDC159]
MTESYEEPITSLPLWQRRLLRALHEFALRERELAERVSYWPRDVEGELERVAEVTLIAVPETPTVNAAIEAVLLAGGEIDWTDRRDEHGPMAQAPDAGVGP